MTKTVDMVIVHGAATLGPQQLMTGLGFHQNAAGDVWRESAALIDWTKPLSVRRVVRIVPHISRGKTRQP